MRALTLKQAWAVTSGEKHVDAAVPSLARMLNRYLP